MDKQLLKAYIRTIVEEEVEKLLPKLLGEAISEIKKVNSLNESVHLQERPKPQVDKGRLAQLLGIEYDRENETIRMTRAGEHQAQNQMLTVKDEAGNMRQIPTSAVDPEVVKAVTKDYSALMKKMGLS